MPRNVLNLELSSGGFSAGALEGVVAREATWELRAEFVEEPGAAFSGARADMVLCCGACLCKEYVQEDKGGYLEGGEQAGVMSSVERRCTSDALALATPQVAAKH
jgi:hypothetical protein